MSEAYLQEALSISKKVGFPFHISNTLYEFGNLFLSEQRLETAETYYREILATSLEGGQEMNALAKYGLARVAATKGIISEAQQLGNDSVSILEALGHRSAREIRSWLETLAK